MFRLLGFGLCLSLCLTTGACERKRRFDGTCTEDAHCLEMQKCSGGVCVRRDPIFKDTVPKPVTEPAAIQPARRSDPPEPAAPTEPDTTPRPTLQPRDRPPEKRSAPPSQQGSFRFRLDA